MQQEGFSGLDGRTSIFDWCTVPALQHPDQTVLKRYRSLLALAQTPPFASGKTFDLGYCQDSERFSAERHFAFLRSDGSSTWLVVSNFGAEGDITVRIPPKALEYLGVKLLRTVYTLHIPPRDYKVLELE